jgi:hypothetical protein
MTTFVIDAQVAIDLATGGATIPPTLTLLHSQALAPLPYALRSSPLPVTVTAIP